MTRDRWRELCERLGCPTAIDRFDELRRAYSEKQRRYHTSRHIRECLSVFDSLRALCQHPDEVELATWLHDVVYEPHRSDNEERSARVATRWLEACRLDAATVARVRDLILATRHDREPRTEDEQVLVDVDRHILGAPPARYDEYEAQIRAEYRWVPSAIFRRRRAEILERFLTRDFIYHTDECRSRYEDSARSNLRRSLARIAD